MKEKLESILDLINFSKENKTINKFVDLGNIDKNIQTLILEELGIDIKNYKVILDASSITHVMKEHGNQNQEKRRGLVAVNYSDFLLIPFIIKKADNIEYVGKNKRGLDCFKYSKLIGDIYYYVEEIRTKQKQLCLNTLYKKPSK